jgi:hypothetical protein
VPRWYSCLLWQIVALRAFVLSRTDLGSTAAIPNRVFWIGLAATALLLSLDEAAQIHEMIGAIAERYGMVLPVYAWVPFGIAFAALLAVAFGRFILGLPRAVALMILASGFIFVLGAIGFESLGALVELGSLSDFFLSESRGIKQSDLRKCAKCLASSCSGLHLPCSKGMSVVRSDDLCSYRRRRCGDPSCVVGRDRPSQMARRPECRSRRLSIA